MTAGSAPTSEAESRPGAASVIGIWHRFVRWELASVVIALVLICTALVVFVPAFRSAYNLRALGFTVAIAGVVSLAQLSVLAVGHFNLALTAIGAMVGLLTGWLMQVGGLPAVPAVAIGIAFGCLAGAAQGLIIVRTGINPFIISLALAATYFGALLGLSRGASFNRLPASFVALGHELLFGIPVLLLISGVVAVAWTILFRNTAAGRKLLASGANVRAALMSGLPTGRIAVAAHVLSGGLAGVAAVMLVARLGSAQPSLGSEWLLPSFAAPVLGGTLLTGGRVVVSGTYLGALLLAVIANGLVLFGVSAYWYQSLLGVVLLAALAIDRARQSYVLRNQL